MKLLFAFPEPLPLPRARGTQVAWMCHALCAAGVDVTLASVPSPDGHPLQPIAKAPPVNLQLLPISNRWPFPFGRWHSVSRFASLLAQQIDSARPDAIFVRHIKLAYQLLRMRPKIPLIYEAHEVFAANSPTAKRRPLAIQEAFVLKNAAGVVYISSAVQQALHRDYAFTNREIVLHSATEIPVAPATKDWANCARHIVYAGSFFNWKGVDDLVDAAAELPGYRMTLIGGEPAEIERLHGRIAPQGAEVILLPRMSPAEVFEQLRIACIAVLPNRAEGVSHFTSPLKLFEYLGAGCAVVAADLPSVREVLGEEEGRWFRPGSSASLAEAIRSLAEAPELARACGAAAARKAGEYTWQGRAEALRRFIDSLLKV
jgi:glycosyltransferase involved in cell wall biosynthesis